ncbi:MAG: glycine C-acetyltransferase [Candidatus Eisenbacteria bacterium]|nr:glycine C-acetyltransferase [Candidatus Eisenbacteria bacterium]
MYGKIKEDLRQGLADVRQAGLYKSERIITSHQGPEIRVSTGQKVLNFCANNYLGLSSHPKVLEAAAQGLRDWGYGMSSVRFICGTQEIHKTLERKIADFLGMEDAILYAACFDANGGVFEPFMDKDCAILTDALNHASVIDGIRLAKAQRFIYNHMDMADLEAKLKEAAGAKYRLIATDGVFSMDGDIAGLGPICDLAEKHDAIVMVDDSHATGFMGAHGRGTHEYNKVMGRVDLITTTFGKALGGASGGCTAGPKEMIEWLRQKSRPYLFSNTLAPTVAAGTVAVMDLLSSTTELRDKLERNQRLFRKLMSEAGFDIRKGDHPIVPIMFGKYENDAQLAQSFAEKLLAEGIYVIGFSYPVVPRGAARIRVQLSAAHEEEHIRKAVAAFTKIGKELKVIA